MTATTPSTAPAPAQPELTFPTLSKEQIARVAVHGRARSVAAGEVVVEAGHQNHSFFVVTAGRLDIFQSGGATEQLIASVSPGQFTGEKNMLSGQRGLATIRAVEPSEVVEVSREDLLALIQTDAELSEILLRAFILRRVELIAHGFGDVIVLGSSYCAATLRVREFLTRNGHPYTSLDLDRDPGVQEILDHFNVKDG